MQTFFVWNWIGVQVADIEANNHHQAIEIAKKRGVVAPMVQSQRDFEAQMAWQVGYA